MKTVTRLFTTFVFAMWCFTISSAMNILNISDNAATPLCCQTPPFLQQGDTVALVSPAYFTPMENVYRAAEVLRGWGLTPVIAPNVGLTYAGKYSGTVSDRLSDLRWALNNPNVKAIICNRGGYGALHLVDQITPSELSQHPKWLVGFSDISTLHQMLTCAGVMSIHGTMSSFLAKGGSDDTSTLMRDMLMGVMPTYKVNGHPQNRMGMATGTLVGGNLCTFVPLVGTWADATSHDDIILFIEEVEESFHNIDRQLNILRLNGVLNRCKGVILGEFTDCGKDLEYESVEAMLCTYFDTYGIPVICGFPAGHGDVNLPLVMGAPVTIDVRENGATISFGIDESLSHTVQKKVSVAQSGK